jgi:hypothetical protein
MILEIIKLCNILPYYNGGECIEIAKGKFATIKKIKQLKEQIKRDFKTKFK